MFWRKSQFQSFPKTPKIVLLIAQQPNIAQRPFCIQNERLDILGVEGGDIIGHERGSGGLNGVGGVVDWCFGLSTATITTIMTHDHHHNHHYYHHHL